MSEHIEVEEKFYYDFNVDLVPFIEKTLHFYKKDYLEETDEYFTDLNVNFIKEKICLRIRQNTTGCTELTYKGKSLDTLSSFTKLETTISLKKEEYPTVKNLLKALGYYSYCTVRKKRVIYTKVINSLPHQIMIDTIDNIGHFIELEILGTPQDDLKKLKHAFSNFEKMFSTYSLTKAVLPYRDFTAESLFQKLKIKQIKNIVFKNFDQMRFYFEPAVLNRLQQEGIFIQSQTQLNDKETIYFELDHHQVKANGIPFADGTQPLLILLAQKIKS